MVRVLVVAGCNSQVQQGCTESWMGVVGHLFWRHQEGGAAQRMSEALAWSAGAQTSRRSM
jgi:hypothetical protein